MQHLHLQEFLKPLMILITTTYSLDYYNDKYDGNTISTDSSVSGLQFVLQVLFDLF